VGNPQGGGQHGGIDEVFEVGAHLGLLRWVPRCAGRVLVASPVVWAGIETTGLTIIFEASERVRQAATNLKIGIAWRLQRSSIAPRTGSGRRHGLVFYPTG